MSIAEKIKAAEKEITALKETLFTETKKLEDDSAEGFDYETQIEVVEGINADVEAKIKRLETFKRAETNLMASAEPVEKQVATPAIVQSKHLGTKGGADLLVKSAVATMESYLNRRPFEEVMQERYGNDEALKAVASTISKAAQNPAMTNVSGWAEELTRDTYAEFMDLLQPYSVVPNLPLSRYQFNGFHNIKIPMRNAAATPNLQGAFRAEGAAIRVGAVSLGSKTLTPKSMGIIGTFTNEMFRDSTPNIEAKIRQWMLEDGAIAIDSAFLSATAGTAIQPAGIQNGVTGGDTAASGGTTSADMNADLKARQVALAGHNLGRRPVWIMNDKNFIALQYALTATGTLQFPEIANGMLHGIPVVKSTTVAADTILLVDCEDIGFAGGTPMFMGTEVATIHEEGDQADVGPIVAAGTGGAGATAATDVNNPIRSLYQTNTSALRMTMDLDWSVLRSGSVQIISGCAWT